MHCSLLRTCKAVSLKMFYSTVFTTVHIPMYFKMLYSTCFTTLQYMYLCCSRWCTLQYSQQYIYLFYLMMLYSAGFTTVHVPLLFKMFHYKYMYNLCCSRFVLSRFHYSTCTCVVQDVLLCRFHYSTCTCVGQDVVLCRFHYSTQPFYT